MSILVADANMKIIDVGVDWLTCSRVGGGIGSDFYALAEDVLERERRAGDTITPHAFRGYVGRRGSKTFYGTQNHDAIVILSGGTAPALACQFIEASTNVSRLDLQITVQRALPDKALGNITYHQAASGGLNRGCKPIVQRIHNTKLGETVSIGSRISDQYGRMYDKGVESKTAEAGFRHRFEVEYKRTQALHHARQLVTSERPLDVIKGTVLAWWRSRGVDPLPGESGRYLIDILPQTQPKPDLLRWFETTVKQSVATAIRAHGLRQTLDSLGLLDALLNYKED